MQNMHRRLLTSSVVAFVLSLSFLFGAAHTEAASPFPDMPASGTNEIIRLHNDGILLGNPDGTLKPHQEVTRAEAVTLIGRALKLDGTKRATRFTDVPAHHYASGYIATGVERGLISGTSATTFSPRDKVTRAQMAVFLQRGFNLNETRPDVMYRDVTSQTFGAHAINTITTARISAGYPDGSFGPNRGTTRLEFALFLARALYPEFKIAEFKPHPDVLAQRSKKAIVINAPEGLNVRQTPNTNYPPIGKLQNGEEISYFATVGNWAAFYFEGKLAYVSLSYLQPASSSSGPGLKGKLIVVDPGHGDHDPGATANNVREKDINLDIGLRLRDKLEKAGATVIMTRDKDVFLELSERVAIANNNNADAFISIHNNAAVATANGTETYWNRTYASSESKKLAEEIQRELIKRLKTRDRGVKEGNFYVIRNTRMTSVLVEVGFVTNPEEAKKLADPAFREEAAEAIFQGIKNFYE